MLPTAIGLVAAIEEREREIQAELFVRSLLRREPTVTRPYRVVSRPAGEARSPRRP